MAIARLTVFLPCHTFDDFPTWLDEAEAEDLLAAWTAAWEPCLIAAVGSVPEAANIDHAPADRPPRLGIVPAAFGDRFAAPPAGPGESRFIERVTGAGSIALEAARALGIDAEHPRDLPGGSHAADFRALGLAVLLSELLARRMRSTPELSSTGFAAAAVAAARAAVANDDAAVEESLRECYGFLEGCRARYYPVDVWLLELILVSATTTPASLAAELEALVPCGLVVEARLPGSLAASAPDLLAGLRAAVASGRVSVLGGRQGDEPLDLGTPEEIAASFQQGLACWHAVGIEPRVFARYAGGATPLLPAVLSGFGFTGMVWSTFDGGALPVAHAGRARWEGAGGAIVEMMTRPPLDARRAGSILGLAERLGDAMDHDHVASLAFARFAGCVGPWHDLLRRIGARSSVLGRFVTPDEYFQKTADGGSLLRFEPDAFVVTLPENTPHDLVGSAVDAAGATARELVCRSEALVPWLPRRPAANPPETKVELPGTKPHRWSFRRPEKPALDNGLLRVVINPETGGLLSVRRPADRGNRLSQQLAVREPSGGDAAPRYTRMRADSIAAGTTACGAGGIVVSGTLIDAAGTEVARFTQGISLAADLPLAVLDIAVEPARPLAGPALEWCAVSRFAWNENDDLEIRRSLHTQSVPTQRDAFTAPHFIELRPAGIRGGDIGSVAILTGGLPWHALASPHVLDTVLHAGGGPQAATAPPFARRLAVGVGLEGLGPLALAFAAAAPLAGVIRVEPPTVRITVGAGEPEPPESGRDPARDAGEGDPGRIGLAEPGGAGTLVRIGLLESAGRAGDVRVEWAREPRAARACDLRGLPRTAHAGAPAPVAIDGRCTVVFLRAYEWLHLEVEFAA